MAQDSKQADATEDGDFLPDMPVHTEEESEAEALAIGLDDINDQALDSSEVARHL